VTADTGCDLVAALWSYDGAVKSMVLSAKNGGRVDVLRELGRRLAPLVSDSVSTGGVMAVPVITWVPACRSARRRRGYDQGRVLARAVAAELGWSAVPLLRRRPGPPQTGRSRAQRLDGPVLRAPVAVAGPVVLIDDVITTGASMRESAAALRRAGASTLIGAAVAATSAGGSRSPAGRAELV
jgi:predicted amidophosphoribosyltransferase